MKQENWINEVLESTKGMQKAEPSPFLFEQIIAKINKGEFATVAANPFLKWGLTSVVLIILSLNIISIVNSNNSAPKTSVTALGSYFNNSTTYNY